MTLRRTLLAVCALPLALVAASGNELADKVNVLIGTTGPKGVVNYGGVCPWVTPPHGMTHWTPMTQENEISRLPYRNEQRTLIGFMGTHQPTVWMGDYGFLTLLPETGLVQLRAAGRGLPILPGTEDARPYRYSVQLGRGEAPLRAEMTAAARSAMFRIAFPPSAPRHLFVEMSRLSGYEGWVKVSADGRELVGYNSGRHNTYHGRHMGPELTKFRGYFVIEFERPVTSYGTWSDTADATGPAPAVAAGQAEIKGERVGAVVDFSDAGGEPVKFRIGSSFISLEQARDNLRREIPDWDFDALAARTRDAWNRQLERAQISGASPDQETIFYTALYHCLLFPRAFDEYGRYYSAFDERIHAGVSFNDYSMWDTFRALHPLLTLLNPEVVSPMMQSLVQMADEGGWMPKWPNPTYSNIMIGTPADSIVADAVTKGFHDFDVEKAYAALYKDAMTPPDGDDHKRWADRAEWSGYEARAGLTYYKALGFVPADKTNESVSCTLEYAYEDYCVAQVAKALGKDDDYRRFSERARNYVNLYDARTGFMQPKLANGAFFDGDPKRYSAFTEGSPWTYLFCVMHDVPGQIKLMGREAFIAKLDENFHGGHYAYDNEPENHYPYLYDWVNQPEKAQDILTGVVEKNYRNTADGITGNDDCGQMSAWYVFTTLGFYPVAPGSGVYALGRPFFPRVVLQLRHPTDNTLVIEAHDLSPTNRYVASVRLDGRELTTPFITHADLVRAHRLEFQMTAQPVHR